MTYIPPARPSIRVIRTSPYKGGTRKWGNRFFFNGPNFTLAEFETVKDFLRLDLKQFLMPTSSITECVGYDIGSDVPVFTDSSSTAGIYVAGTNPVMPLETAALWRFTTDQRSVKNHPIYLFKYMHAVQNDGTSDNEKLRAGMKSTMEGQLANLLAGYNDGTRLRQFCDHAGAVAQGGIVKGELTHRDFPNL